MSKRKPTIKWMKEQNCLHIETNNCIVNIRQGLKDRLGRNVTSIEVIPDRYSGEPKRKLLGYANTRIIDLKTKKV